MIHTFPMFSRTAADTELGRALDEVGIEYRIFAGGISRSYRSRLGLFLVVLPRIAWFALRCAIASLVISRPRPDTVIISSDIEALIFRAIRFLAGRRRTTRIVFGTFIYTSRDNPRLEAWRRAYYRLVLRGVDVAIVHSRLECARYPALFPGLRTQFRFVRYGLAIEARAAFIAQATPPARPLLVTSGRSGRDYATLIAAVAGLDVETHIICDLASAIPNLPAGSGVTVLARCHGDCLLREMARATIIVVPLAATNISAGQMVLVQAKALHRPLIVTDTPTVRDYLTDGHDALLVAPGDTDALRAAITRLLTDPELRDRLSANGAAGYLAHHTTIEALRNTLAAIGQATRPGEEAPDRRAD